MPGKRTGRRTEDSEARSLGMIPAKATSCLTEANRERFPTSQSKRDVESAPIPRQTQTDLLGSSDLNESRYAIVSPRPAFPRNVSNRQEFAGGFPARPKSIRAFLKNLEAVFLRVEHLHQHLTLAQGIREKSLLVDGIHDFRILPGHRRQKGLDKKFSRRT